MTAGAVSANGQWLSVTCDGCGALGFQALMRPPAVDVRHIPEGARIDGRDLCPTCLAARQEEK